MGLGHEKLDVYRLSIGCVAWVCRKSEALNQGRKQEPDRMAAILSRLGGRGCQAVGERAFDGREQGDFDPDNDFDVEKRKSQKGSGCGRIERPEPVSRGSPH